jgi:hypothetical protein
MPTKLQKNLRQHTTILKISPFAKFKTMPGRRKNY